MFRSSGLAVLGLACVALAGGPPLASVSNFNGKFVWVKLSPPSASALKSLGGAKSMELTISFARDAKLKKDKNGNVWLTIILADQGASDWKWHQTTGSGGVPTKGDSIKAGTYKVSIPLAGIPATVLREKSQSISIGPGCSGLAGTVPFKILSLQGR